MTRTISRRTFWCTAVLALANSACVRGRNAAGQDVWAAVALASAMLAAEAALLTVVNRCFPDKNLFELFHERRSLVTAKLLTILWLLIGLGCAARTVQSHGEFIQTCVLPETPHFVVAAALIGVCACFAAADAPVLTRWGGLVFPLAAILWLTLMGMSVQRWEPAELLPVLGRPDALFDGIVELAAFPGGELIFLTALFPSLEPPAGRRRITLMGAVVAGLALVQLVTFTANILVLSREVVENTPYAAYFMTSTIGVGDFFRHVEALTTFLSSLCVIAQLSLQLIFLTQGLAALFAAPKPAAYAIPAALLTYGLSGCVTFAAAGVLNAAAGVFSGLPFLLLPAAAAFILCPSHKIGTSAR